MTIETIIDSKYFMPVVEVLQLLACGFIAYILFKTKLLRKAKPIEKPKIEIVETPQMKQLNQEILSKTKKPLSEFEKGLLQRYEEIGK